MTQEEQSKFSWTRLIVFLGVASLTYKAVGPGSASSILIGLGLVALAFFSGFHDPLSATDENYRPRNSKDWLALFLGVAGSALVIVGAFI